MKTVNKQVTGADLSPADVQSPSDFHHLTKNKKVVTLVITVHVTITFSTNVPRAAINPLDARTPLCPAFCIPHPRHCTAAVRRGCVCTPDPAALPCKNAPCTGSPEIICRRHRRIMKSRSEPCLAAACNAASTAGLFALLLLPSVGRSSMEAVSLPCQGPRLQG
ncbi:hypothetical protein B0J18DRAFT_120245 [Chaetomium sp. MPI-SDFR-AT-0129]|nr:hypothetical protein B0J18DRAFT_120245 [Chaetomium sp. MPI-SDFR-AT-0129]